MTIEILRNIFFWSAALNYAVLLLWFAAFTLAHGRIFRLHAKWFRISVRQFDATHYAGMAIYKIGIFLFALGPYIACRLAA